MKRIQETNFVMVVQTQIWNPNENELCGQRFHFLSWSRLYCSSKKKQRRGKESDNSLCWKRRNGSGIIVPLQEAILWSARTPVSIFRRLLLTASPLETTSISFLAAARVSVPQTLESPGLLATFSHVGKSASISAGCPKMFFIDDPLSISIIFVSVWDYSCKPWWIVDHSL